MTKIHFSPPGIFSDRTHPEDPVPGWRTQLQTSTPETLIRLLVDIAAWAHQHPKSPEAWTLLGDTYLHIKQPYAAEKAFTTALGASPKHAPAREGLGLALMQTGRPTEALKHLGIAHQLDTASADILVHWGLALLSNGNLKAAHNRFLLALKRDERHIQAWLNLGVVDTRRGAWDNAIYHFQQSCRLKPDFAEALHNLALAQRHVGQLTEALETATTLTGHHPSHAANWVLLAELHLNAGQLDLAEEALQKAMEVDPGSHDIYLTRALLYSAQRQYSDAEGVMKTALALSRDDPNIQLEMGHLHLLLGRFGSGWDLYEARKHIAQSPVRRFPLKEWRGEDLTAQTVLVHAEQGLGDTIMFANCLPDLIQLARHVVIEVSTRLASLFARSFPTATVIGRDPQATDMGWLERLHPPVAYQIPIGNLPKHFRRERGHFPPHTGYLKANPQRTAFWRDRLSQHRRPLVGLTWRGGLLHTGSEQRSFHLAAWASTLRSVPVQWVSLQYGEVAAQDIAEAASHGLEMLNWPDTLKDQDEVAALTCALDAVATVCCTQAHLTGALGRQGWVLTPFNPNWRYGASGEAMPWYPSLQLVRQTARDDWNTPMDALQRHLTTLYADSEPHLNRQPKC